MLLTHPAFAAPLFFSWGIYALLASYLVYLHPWEALGATLRVLTGLGAAFTVTLTLTAANHITLELIQQIEKGQPSSLIHAAWEVISWNMLHSLLIVLLWTPLWFIFTIIDITLGEDEDGSHADEHMIGPAVGVVGGDLRSFQFSRAFLRVLSKTMRLGVFLILPAIAWEQRGAIPGARRGLSVLRWHVAEFSTGLITSEIFAFVLLFPLILFFSLVQGLELSLPQEGLPLGILYFTLTCSLIFYVEQIFAALLFLWHLRWEAAWEPDRDSEAARPKLADIPMPSLLDSVSEFD